MSLRIYLTGSIAVELDGVVAIRERELRGKQGRLAFAYLVCQRTRPVSREELAALLWPEDMPPAWQVGLSAILSKLQRLLASGPLKAAGVALSKGIGQYQMVLPVDTWIDLETCASALDEAEGSWRAGAPGSILRPATVAATIAGRPFLPGIEGEWADSQRRRLERQHVRSLECLAHMWIANGEPALAIETSSKAVALDPFRESSHQLLMRAHAAGGNRPEAIRAYQRLRSLLAVELGTEPSAETEGSASGSPVPVALGPRHCERCEAISSRRRDRFALLATTWAKLAP
ncbi:MAG: BTAD domain-containing putative transcriptional regulator [Dehalococcoidia bacterium]|nr:BTAD domain-containing putative transcriptional regulator [Dehalococcoidia bacterium]